MMPGLACSNQRATNLTKATTWDSKDHDCLVVFPSKDHCFTKEFQLTNPGDSYFYSLGLAGTMNQDNVT